jgi:hypothetical protein
MTSASAPVTARGVARVPSPLAIFSAMLGEQPATSQTPKIDLRPSVVAMAVSGVLTLSALLSTYASLSAIEAIKSGLQTIFP